MNDTVGEQDLPTVLTNTSKALFQISEQIRAVEAELHGGGSKPSWQDIDMIDQSIANLAEFLGRLGASQAMLPAEIYDAISAVKLQAMREALFTGEACTSASVEEVHLF